MSDRFELEQEILRVWGTVEDLKTVHYLVLDGTEPLTEDEMSNIIMGIEQTLDLRCRKLWDTFCKVYELDRYRKMKQEIA